MCLNLECNIIDFTSVPPEIHHDNIDLNPYVVVDKSIVLSCHRFGIPQINYYWFKDNKSLFDAHSYAR